MRRPAPRPPTTCARNDSTRPWSIVAKNECLRRHRDGDRQRRAVERAGARHQAAATEGPDRRMAGARVVVTDWPGYGPQVARGFAAVAIDLGRRSTSVGIGAAADRARAGRRVRRRPHRARGPRSRVIAPRPRRNRRSCGSAVQSPWRIQRPHELRHARQVVRPIGARPAPAITLPRCSPRSGADRSSASSAQHPVAAARGRRARSLPKRESRTACSRSCARIC